MDDCSHTHYAHEHKYLVVVVILIATFLVELVGGLFSHSLTLMSDTAHVGFDIVMNGGIGLVVTLYAKRDHNPVRQAFIKTVGAMVSSLCLIMVAVVIVATALFRIRYVEHVDGPLALAVTTVGLLANGACLFLYRHSHGDRLLQASRWHVLADLASSLVAFAGNGLVTVTGHNYWDTWLSFVLAGVLGTAGGYLTLSSARAFGGSNGESK